MASFEEIVTLEDAAIQSRIGRAPDLILAAALADAPGPQREAIRRNLSERRLAAVEECAASAGKLPPRVREVGRRVVAKILFGIEDEETRGGLAVLAQDAPPKPAPPMSPRELLMRLMEKHPLCVAARDARRRAAEIEMLRRIRPGE